MNPITLEFLDPDLETELRSTQFRASTFAAELMLVVTQAVHVFMSWFASKYHVISLIYSPLIVIAFVGRHRFAQMEDQGRAHDLNGKMWCLLILIGNTLQRASIFFGLHPIIDMVEATLYMGTYLMVLIILHLQYEDIRYRAFISCSIFLSLATAGWSIIGDSGWTALGQPYDTAIIAATLVFGHAIGFSLEAMLRASFLQRIESRERYQHQKERGQQVEFEADLRGHAFEQLGIIGRGGSADVFLVRKGGFGVSAQLYAMKRISKRRLTQSQVERVLEESQILQSIEHPFLVSLHYAFQSERCFYFAMTYAGGGDLTRWADTLSVSSARLVIAEVLLALEYLHSKSIIYRDVKPENTLIADDGHVLLADFGVSKRVANERLFASSSSSAAGAGAGHGGGGGGRPSSPEAVGSSSSSSSAERIRRELLHKQRQQQREHEMAQEQQRRLEANYLKAEDPLAGAGAALSDSAAPSTRTQVGTIEYMAPEVFAGEAYSFEVDFWAMGVMLHEILTGFTIGSYKAPAIATDLLEPAAGAFIRQLLTPVREVRLGCGSGGARAIKEHAFFEGLDFTKVAAKDGPAPLNLKRLTMNPNDMTEVSGQPERGAPSRFFGQGAELRARMPGSPLRCDASQTTCSSGSSANLGSERSS